MDGEFAKYIPGNRLPTTEEILSGQSQAGVPRPAFLKDDDADGSVESLVPADVRDKLNQ